MNAEGDGAARPGRSARLACAALAGASGLGLEVVAVGAAGLSLGFSRAAALGLGTFVAGWALGAAAAGRSRRPARWLLLWAGAASALLCAVVPPLLIARGADPGGGTAAAALALASVFLCGLPQGLFLPALAQSERGVAGIFAANLFGSVAGATGLGFGAAAAFGRPAAGLAAGALALLAGALGALGSRGAPGPGSAHGRPPAEPAGPESPFPAWVVVGAVTVWTIGTEWTLLRLSVLWVGSREAALASVVGASLLALAAGAALLPALLPRGAGGVACALALALPAQAWPSLAAPALEALGRAGAADFWVVLALVGPPLLPLGAVVPLLHRALGPSGGGRAGARLGRLLLHEAWAAPLAGPLVHWGLVPGLGLGDTLAALPLLGLPAGLALRRRAPQLGPGLAGLSALAALGLGALPDPVLAAPALGNPAFTVLSVREDAEFTVAVVEDGLLGERALLTDTFRAAGDGRDSTYMRVLGHLPLLLHPEPSRVAVVALGTGTTVGSVSLHARAREIDVLEISAAVVAAADVWFRDVNRGALSDPRVRVRLGDGRLTLANSPGRYDVVTIEPLLPDSPFGVYLYTEGFYAVARRALAPGGLLCQWVPPHALEPPVFDAVLDAFRRAFPWSGIWTFGSQVVLIGGEAAPALDPRGFPAPEARGAEGELRTALAELGLATPAGVAARYVCAGPAWPPSERRLRDADPWIVYRRKAEGAAALDWLPANLGRLAQRREPEAPWPTPGDGLRAALGELLTARVVQGRAERDLVRGARAPGEARAAVDVALTAALRAAPDDPEVRAFADQVRFLGALRDGVARLGAGDARGAVDLLVTAAELRGERADAHLYLAVALGALGLEAASARALEAALERCPRLAETPPGRRAEALGLDPRRWPAANRTRYKAPGTDAASGGL